MTHQQAVSSSAAERYLLDEMPELERFGFEAHYFECAECADDVRTGARMADGVKGGLLPDAPATTISRPLLAATAAPTRSTSTWKTVLPWAVAATLAVSLGYQSLVPRSTTMSSQAVSPVTLRAATRGADPVVTPAPDGFQAFALDAGTVPVGTRLTYDLRTAADTSVASGTAAAPEAGAPLVLIVPAAALRTAGIYTVRLRPADGSGPAPADYRFVVTN